MGDKTTRSNNDSIQRAKIIQKYNEGAVKSNTDEWENPQYSLLASTDYYGFIHEDGLTAEFIEKENKIKKGDLKREAKWRKLLVKKTSKKQSTSVVNVGAQSISPFGDIYIKMKDSKFREELTKRIYKGVPQIFKATLWQTFLEIPAIKQSKPRIYQEMLARALRHSPDINQIDLDVNRTFRNTTYFLERYNSRQKALMHVLAAYSMYNTEIGYCQGMSEIAGLLLMYLVEEEDVFWGLSQLMTLPRYSMHGVFVAGFPRLLTLFNHFTHIIQTLLPKIARHFDKLDIMVSSYALKWFMQCYLDRVPLTLFLRLWDIFMMEGERLLIAMAYNIMKMHKKRLLKMDHGGILSFLQSDLRKDFQYDDDTVVESLKICIEELKRSKLAVPPSPEDSELPSRPFGTNTVVNHSPVLPSPTSVKRRQSIQANPEESIRQSLKRQSLSSTTNKSEAAKSTQQTTTQPSQQKTPLSNNTTSGPVKFRITNNTTSSHTNKYNTNNKSSKSTLPKSKSLYLAEKPKKTTTSRPLSHYHISNNSTHQPIKTAPTNQITPRKRAIKSVPNLHSNNSNIPSITTSLPSNNHNKADSPAVSSLTRMMSHQSQHLSSPNEHDNNYAYSQVISSSPETFV